MKKTVQWAMGVAALAVLLVAVAVALNATDEPLNAAASTMGEPRAAGVPDVQNGYLAVIGMAAGDGEDGAAYAAAWLAEARAAAREQRPEKPVAVKRAQRPAWCDPSQTACLAVAQDNAASITAQLSDFKEDIYRYDRLLAAPAYEEILDYRPNLESQFPRYAALGAAQRAWLMRAPSVSF